jgi:AcrR family transcriptional regulator
LAPIDSLTRGEKTAQAVRSAAIRLFFVHGYEATTLRLLASEVGITVGSVYNHIESKEDLLYSIMSDVMRELREGVDAVLIRRTDPVSALRAAAEFHVIFHARRAQEVLIGNSELRRLPPARRAAVIESRDAYESTFRRLLDDGRRAGVFRASDPRLIVYAIIAMGTHVAGWYQPGGPQTLEHIAAVYADFILAGLHSPEESAARPAGVGELAGSPLLP